MKRAKDLRSNNVIKFGGEIFLVLKAEHYNPSEKASVMKLKLQNVFDGKIKQTQINASDNIDDLRLTKKNMQYLYNSGNLYTFMDLESYDQIEIEKDMMGEKLPFLQEEMEVLVQFYEGKVIMVDLPDVVEVEIIFTNENIDKGNTARSVVKDAELANGHVVKVPDFIKIGEIIKVDTRTGEYISRA